MPRRTDALAHARRVAAGQKGLITHTQARECGLTRHQVDGYVRRGEWDRVFRGVLCVAPTEPRWQQTALAICLAGGRGVATSHETAGALLGLDGFPRHPGQIHVTTTKRLKLQSRALIVHETKRPFGIRRVQGVPSTLVERTLLDLAATENPQSVELALEDALRRRLTTIDRVISAIAQDGGKGRPGSKVLRELTASRGRSAPTDSGLETKVWKALTKARLRGLVRQHPVQRPDGSVARIDLAFPLFKIAIEVDSFRWHSGREAWHRDLARRNDLVALGWTVLHATKEDVDEGCKTLIETIRGLMGEQYLDLPEDA